MLILVGSIYTLHSVGDNTQHREQSYGFFEPAIPLHSQNLVLFYLSPRHRCWFFLLYSMIRKSIIFSVKYTKMVQLLLLSTNRKNITTVFKSVLTFFINNDRIISTELYQNFLTRHNNVFIETKYQHGLKKFTAK